MSASGRTALIALAVLAALAIVALVAKALVERKRERERMTEQLNLANTPATWDPALCEHTWVEYDRGACLSKDEENGPDASPLPCASYVIYVCPKCGSTSFTCTETDLDRHTLTGAHACESCPYVPDCPAELKTEQPKSGPIECEPVGSVMDDAGIEYARFKLRDRFGNERLVTSGGTVRR